MEPTSPVNTSFLETVVQYEMNNERRLLPEQPSSVFKWKHVTFINYDSSLKIEASFRSNTADLHIDFSKKSWSVYYELNPVLFPQLDTIVITHADVQTVPRNANSTASKVVITLSGYFKDGNTFYPVRLSGEHRYNAEVKLLSRQQFDPQILHEAPTFRRDVLIKATESLEYVASLTDGIFPHAAPPTAPAVDVREGIEVINASKEIIKEVSLRRSQEQDLLLQLTIEGYNAPRTLLEPITLDKYLFPEVKALVIKRQPYCKSVRPGLVEYSYLLYIAQRTDCIVAKIIVAFAESNNTFGEPTVAYTNRVLLPPAIAKSNNSVSLYREDIASHAARLFRSENGEFYMVISQTAANGYAKPRILMRNLDGRWMKAFFWEQDAGKIKTHVGTFFLGDTPSLQWNNAKTVRLLPQNLVDNEALMDLLGIQLQKVENSLEIDHERLSKLMLLQLGESGQYLLSLNNGDANQEEYIRYNDGAWRKLTFESRSGMSIIGNCTYYYEDGSSFCSSVAGSHFRTADGVQLNMKKVESSTLTSEYLRSLGISFSSPQLSFKENK